MCYKILITGSSGLIGSSLSPMLKAKGIETIPFDLHAPDNHFGDVRDIIQVRKAIQGCDGVIHLAAISRVHLGEQNPELCRGTNVQGVENILTAASESETKPWVIFTSSREVYGQPQSMPVAENCPLCPINVYGRSKAQGEELINAARQNGIRACTVRLSNVYGSTDDHADRVVPAFAKGAILGETLRINGADHTFDFTHTHDVCRGIALLAEHLRKGNATPPPINLVSGEPTTLGDLARLAIEMTTNGARIFHTQPRAFDVNRFIGDRSRALALLGWTPEISLKEGLEDLIQAFQDNLPLLTNNGAA